MTELEKRAESKIRLKKQLKAKVRRHRPPEKVLELEIMMVEDQLHMLAAHEKNLEWTKEYLKGLNPTEIAPEGYTALNIDGDDEKVGK